jgi:ubiquinone/menaquinone biosynthesis C-methylase UbiE
MTVLAEFHRVLKPGGRLVLVNMTFGEKLGSGIYQRLYRLSPALMGGCRGVRMSDLLQRNGFSVHLREYVQQLLFPSEVILASKGSAQQSASADADQPRR